MTFKVILTVTGPDHGDADLELAASLCEQVDAHLSTLVVTSAAPPPVGEYAGMVSSAWLQEREEDARRLQGRTEAVSALLSRGTVSTDISSEYPELAWTDEAIGRRARYADLTVVGPGLSAVETLREKVIEGALFSSGKPLLVVPGNSRATLKPRRLTVAWDAGIEASRAVREALDMLTGAEEVRLALVDPVEGERDHGAEPGADAAAYLARHGVRVTVDRLPSHGRSIAATLRQHAVDTAAEMIVMGAYGHSRLRERIFGGVTRSMLDEAPVPVFLAR